VAIHLRTRTNDCWNWLTGLDNLDSVLSIPLGRSQSSLVDVAIVCEDELELVVLIESDPNTLLEHLCRVHPYTGITDVIRLFRL
jgi:hypothetical protein